VLYATLLRRVITPASNSHDVGRLLTSVSGMGSALGALSPPRYRHLAEVQRQAVDGAPQRAERIDRVVAVVDQHTRVVEPAAIHATIRAAQVLRDVVLGCRVGPLERRFLRRRRSGGMRLRFCQRGQGEGLASDTPIRRTATTTHGTILLARRRH
jgi:hypothetical protein